jgi:hypothetical protein
MLRFAQAPHEEMHRDAILGKMRGDLFAQKNTRSFRDFQASIDRIVVGDRHELHSLLAQALVKSRRFRVTVRQAETTEKPFGSARAVPGVKV